MNCCRWTERGEMTEHFHVRGYYCIYMENRNVVRRYNAVQQHIWLFLSGFCEASNSLSTRKRGAHGQIGDSLTECVNGALLLAWIIRVLHRPWWRVGLEPSHVWTNYQTPATTAAWSQSMSPAARSVTTTAATLYDIHQRRLERSFDLESRHEAFEPGALFCIHAV